ncbi:MAG: dihydroorotate dehydrogenase-like protein [Phototrophicaceae bacterium]
MNLETSYLGLPLKSPLVVSASPLSESLDNIKRMEDAGAGAVVLYSLFEEQIRQEQLALFHHTTYHSDSHAEALSYFPEVGEYHTDSRGYLNLIRRAKEAVDIPIIASLNGTTPGRWTRTAALIDQAGADALDLNLYSIPTSPQITGDEVERADLEVVSSVARALSIPVAVKLSPFFSSPVNMAARFAEAGAKGLVLFNRFYQPDIDLELLEVKPGVTLSTPEALRLPLRWIAIMYGRIEVDFAGSSGVHSGDDAAKLLLAGAKVTMMAAALLRNGIDFLRTVEQGLCEFMAQHEYESVSQLRGALSQMHTENPAAYERAQYMRAILNYPVGIS